MNGDKRLMLFLILMLVLYFSFGIYAFNSTLDFHVILPIWLFSVIPFLGITGMVGNSLGDSP